MKIGEQASDHALDYESLNSSNRPLNLLGLDWAPRWHDDYCRPPADSLSSIDIDCKSR
jgi:hypothetical protein